MELLTYEDVIGDLTLAWNVDHQWWRVQGMYQQCRMHCDHAVAERAYLDFEKSIRDTKPLPEPQPVAPDLAALLTAHDQALTDLRAQAAKRDFTPAGERAFYDALEKAEATFSALYAAQYAPRCDPVPSAPMTVDGIALEKTNDNLFFAVRMVGGSPQGQAWRISFITDEGSWALNQWLVTPPDFKVTDPCWCFPTFDEALALVRELA